MLRNKIILHRIENMCRKVLIKFFLGKIHTVVPKGKVLKTSFAHLLLLFQDGQYYTVTITGLSPTTAVVLFNQYGNYEEVLLADLLPMPGGNSKGPGVHDIAPTPGLPPAFRH